VHTLGVDFIGIGETHLRGDETLSIPGFKWFGQNRRIIHRRAPSGSGGIGLLIKESLLDVFSVEVLYDTHEGILWKSLKHKTSNFSFKICVCYLPPENSTRVVNAIDFFDNLLTGIYDYQGDGLWYLCGDLNSRCAELLDFIEGVDG
jgi:hypothetical protein